MNETIHDTAKDAMNDAANDATSDSRNDTMSDATNDATSETVCRPGSARVAIVGAGGNIGSHAVPLVGRTPEVSTVILVDPDVYTADNLVGQNVSTIEIGSSKVAVQADRLREINPELKVETWAEAVETVPWAALRVDVILACLDSRRARQAVNQIAIRLGVPWIDAGVDVDFGMARISTFLPTLEESPCVECGWGQRDYELLEQVHGCRGAVEAHPTGADASLGSLAASLQVLELQKLLRDSGETALEAVLSVRNLHLRHVVTHRNTECRFWDHTSWVIDTLETGVSDLRLGDLGELGPGPVVTPGAGPFLEVEGGAFVERVWCSSCGGNEPILALDKSLQRQAPACSICGDSMTYRGAEMKERIDISRLDTAARGASMASVGFRPGDLFTIDGIAGVHHYAFPSGTAPTGGHPS